MFKILNQKNNKFASDTFITLISQIIIAISGFLCNIIVGNYFGASGVGVFQLSLSYFVIISLITNLGLPLSVLKFSSENNESEKKTKLIVSNSIFAISTLSLTGVLIIILIYHTIPITFLDISVLKSIGISLIAIPFFGINKIYLSVLNGQRKMIDYSIIQGSRWILILIFVAIISHFRFEVYLLTSSLLLGEIIIFSYYTFKFRKYYVSKINFYELKKLLDFGLKSFLPTVIFQFGQSVAVILVGFFLDNQKVGIYSFASTIALGIVFLPSVIQINFNPIASNLSSKNEYAQLQQYMYKIRKITLLIMIPLNIGILVLYPLIIKIFMKGSEFNDSIIPFYLMMIGISCYSLFNWASGMLSMLGLLKENLIRVSLAMTVNIVLGIILIQYFEVEGAAMALAASYIIQLFLLRYFLKTKCNLILF